MNKLILLRHGQSQWNLENRFTGWTDVSLTDQGKDCRRKTMLKLMLFLAVFYREQIKLLK